MNAEQAYAVLLEIANKMIIGNMISQETFFGSDAHKLLDVSSFVAKQAGYIDGLRLQVRSMTTIEQATRTNEN